MVSYPPTSAAAPFGRYMIRERIARGGMGEVFGAVAVGVDGFEKPVVIKRLLPKFAGRTDLARLFAAEAKLMTRLVHPNIVQVIDFGRGENEDYFLVMELVRGVDVGRLVQWHSKRSSRIPLPIVVFIVSQVLRGLAYAHATFSADGQRLVHRDISPGNVLVSTFGEVKVADFGVALVAVQADANVATPGLVVGKPGYIAPEQFGCSAVDERADLYSLGALFFEALTGELPVMEGSTSPAPGTESAAFARSVQEAAGSAARAEGRASPAPRAGSSQQAMSGGDEVPRSLGDSGSTPSEAPNIKRFAQQLSPRSIRVLRDAVRPEVADVVIRALATAPDDRYPDARTMSHALADLAGIGVIAADADELAELVTKVSADEQANAVPVLVLGASAPSAEELGGTELTRSEGVGLGHFTLQLQTTSSVQSTNMERPHTVRVTPVDVQDQEPPQSQRRESDPALRRLEAQAVPDDDDGFGPDGSELDDAPAAPAASSGPHAGARSREASRSTVAPPANRGSGVEPWVGAERGRTARPRNQAGTRPGRNLSSSYARENANDGSPKSLGHARRRGAAVAPSANHNLAEAGPPPSSVPPASDEDPSRCSWSIIPPSCAPTSARVSPESCAPPFSNAAPDSFVRCSSNTIPDIYIPSSSRAKREQENLRVAAGRGSDGSPRKPHAGGNRWRGACGTQSCIEPRVRTASGRRTPHERRQPSAESDGECRTDRRARHQQGARAARRARWFRYRRLPDCRDSGSQCRCAPRRHQAWRRIVGYG